MSYGPGKNIAAFVGVIPAGQTYVPVAG